MNKPIALDKSLRLAFWGSAIFVLGALTLFSDTTLSMVSIWARSDTFAHGFLILPISVWLVWTQRDRLVSIPSKPSPWLAILLIPISLGWLLAWMVEVLVVQQLALVAMLVVGSWAIMGYRLGRALAFPLLFLFFAVPMGEGLIVPMMDFTAYSTVWMVQQTGIPVYREGLYFTLPTGRWSVVEACSGVRYIIASVTVGALFAYLTYVSLWRRLLFLLISAIVPVFANTARAFIIVMLGHFSDMKVATGADHLVYGWVFFGLVMFLLFWLGSFFREDVVLVKRGDRHGNMATPQDYSVARLISVIVLVLTMASPGLLMANWMVRESAENPQQKIAAVPAANDWTSIGSANTHWEPVGLVGGLTRTHYQRNEGNERNERPVTLALQYSDGSFDLGEVVGSNRFFVWPDGGWAVVERKAETIVIGDEEIQVAGVRVRKGRKEFMAWSWYEIAGRSTANDYFGKLYLAALRLGFIHGPVARVLIYTPVYKEGRVARATLHNFIGTHGASLSEILGAEQTPARP